MNHSGQHIQSVFIKTAASFAEVLCVDHVADQNAMNLFGRRVNFIGTDQFSRLLGNAAAGLRTAACLPAESIEKNIDLLAEFGRFHIPLTIVIEGRALCHLSRLASAGCFVVQARNSQALSDWIIMGQAISERSLIPVVILTDTILHRDEVNLPGPGDLRKWFGDADARLAEMTASQTMVMGRERRRVPAWIQPDNPVMLSGPGTHQETIAQLAARDLFDWSHLTDIAESVTRDFEARFNRTYQAVKTHTNGRTHNLIITTTPSSAELFEKVEADRSLRKQHIGWMELVQLWPLTLPQTTRDLKPETLCVIEPAQSQPDQGWLCRQLDYLDWFKPARVQNGWFVNEPANDALLRVVYNLAGADKGLKRFWLDLDPGRRTSAYPKFQVLLEQTNRDYPHLSEESLHSPEEAANQPVPVMPLAAREYGSQGAPYSRLADFFDHTAAPGLNNLQQTALPFHAYPVSPAASGMLRPAQASDQIRVFMPEKVKEVEAYPGVCPHGALVTGMYSFQDLIKSGITQARTRGEAISMIVPQSKVWAKNAAVIAREKRTGVQKLKEILSPAFDLIINKVAKDPDTLKAEYDAIMDCVGNLPISLTRKYYFEAEKNAPESGLVFIAAIDPQACTGCGVCALATGEGALEMQLKADLDLRRLSEQFRNFNQLPSTSPSVVNQLMEDAQFDPFAALLLQKHLYQSFWRNGVSWQYQAQAMTTGMITATLEATLANRFEEVAKQISVKLAALSNLVKKMLSDALPTSNLDSLMEVVTGHREEKLSMDRVFEEWGREQSFKKLDRADLERKLALMESLKQLKWALMEGLGNRGRAPYTIVLDESADYLSQHPWNNFNVPVIQARAANTADLALGAFEGLLRNALDNIRVLRRAELEATNKYDPDKHAAEIAGLGWSELTPEEKMLVGPVIIVGTDRMLTENGYRSVHRTLAEKPDYPIKIFVLESGSLKPATALGDLRSQQAAYWPLLNTGSSWVARGSVATPDKLFQIMQESIAYQGGSVLGIFTPEITAHTSEAAFWPRLVSLAESTRFFVPWQFQPGEQSFAGSLTMPVTPDSSDWQMVSISLSDGAVTREQEYALSFADYAFTLKEWEAHFTRLESPKDTLTIANYLDLEDRSGKRPVIWKLDKDGKAIYYEVSDLVVQCCLAVRGHFRQLREWAGLHSEFPDKLRELVREELKTEFESATTKMKEKLAAEKRSWEGSYKEELRRQIQERLVQISAER